MMKNVLRIIAVIILLLTKINNAQELRTKVGDVKDSRTTGEFFAGLEVDLQFMGDILENARSVKCTVTKAVDETERDLIKENETISDFLDVDKDNPGRVDVTIKLKNPSRKAMTIKLLEGIVDVYAPKVDPNAVVTIKNFISQSGKTINNPALRSSKVNVSVLTYDQYTALKDQRKTGLDTSGLMGQMVAALSDLFGGFSEPGPNSIILQLSDPDKKIVDVEFIEQSGGTINRQGMTSMGDIYIYDFENKISKNAQLRIYLSTDKSLKAVNFSLKEIDLP